VLPTDLLLAAAGAFGAIVVLALMRPAARAVHRIRRRRDPASALGRIADGTAVELARVLARVDAVRRDEIAAAEIVALLAQTAEATGRAAERVKEIAVPPGSVALHDEVGHDLVRATSAVETILDACLALEGTTRGDRAAQARKSLQWGQVNLAHIQEELAHHAADAEALDAPDGQGWRASRI
jgi:hypothetical protein